MRTQSPPTLALASLLAAGLLLFTACPRAGARRPNIVLVTIESARADRLAGAGPGRDPFPNLRAMMGTEAARQAFASSSETLPSIASILTGESPARHRVLEEGLDRLPNELPTLASILAGAGYRTAAFPTLASLGLASGLARGFQSYGWSPADLVGETSLAETNGEGWVPGGARRQGQAAVGDALIWARRHRGEPMFLWIHLSEAAPPYATDRDLIAQFSGSTYDAALAYEDRCLKSLMDGFKSLGLSDRTIVFVAGDHGESLGANGESFHGLNLYPPALATAVVVLRPAEAGAASVVRGNAPGAPAKLSDLFADILAAAGAAAPADTSARPGLPAISASSPLLAATLGPRYVFGWGGRIAIYDGEWAWFGPAEAELRRIASDLSASDDRAATETARASQLYDRAMADGSPLFARLAGRPGTPPTTDRARLLDLLRRAAEAKEAQRIDIETATLQEAWHLDPGNFEVAKWMVQTSGSAQKARCETLAREVETLAPGMPEALLAAAQMYDMAGSSEAANEARSRACAEAGAACAISLALHLAQSGQYDAAARALQPVAVAANDADIWRTLADVYLRVENTYKAGQALDQALKLKPGDPDLLIRRGDSLAATRDFKGAEASYSAADAAVPGLQVVAFRLGRLARQKGDRTLALEQFRKGVGLDTNTVAGEVALGRVLAGEGMTQEAIPLFLDAASRDTSSVEPLYYAAEALATDGRLEEAEKQLRRALDRDPDSPTILYQLARIVVYRGNRVEGSALLERLATVAPPEIAIAALQDQLFVNDAPGAPLEKGMRALYETAKKSSRGVGAPPGPAPGGSGGATRPGPGEAGGPGGQGSAPLKGAGGAGTVPNC